MEERECELLADFFSLFGCKTRLRIFCALRTGERTVSELASDVGSSIQNISQHLRLMRNKGAVVVVKDGKFARYSIADERFYRGSELIRDGIVAVLKGKRDQFF